MDFSIAESGYDRDEVDRCLADLGAQLALASAQAASAAETRAELALVRRDATRLHALLKARPAVYRNTLRIQQMVALAEEEAAEILAEAKAEREAAHAEAERIREEAYEEATRARRDFEAALQARRRREQLAEETWKRVRVEVEPPSNDGGPRTTPQAAPGRVPSAVDARPGPAANEAHPPSPDAAANAGRNERTNDGAAEPVGPNGDGTPANPGPPSRTPSADAAASASGAPPNPAPPKPGPPDPGPSGPGPSGRAPSGAAASAGAASSASGAPPNPAPPDPGPSGPGPSGRAPSGAAASADAASSASGTPVNGAPSARANPTRTDPVRGSAAQTEPPRGSGAPTGRATAPGRDAGDPAARRKGGKPSSRWPRLRNLLPSSLSR
jgi:hypothetical protein